MSLSAFNRRHGQQRWKRPELVLPSYSIAIVVVTRQFGSVFVRAFGSAVIFKEEPVSQPAASIVAVPIWSEATSGASSRTSPFFERIVTASFSHHTRGMGECDEDC